MSDSTPTLEPCPFPHDVKRGVFLETDTVDFGFVRGACADCGCAGPFVTIGGAEKCTPAEQAEAIRLWNARAALDASGNDELVEALRPFAAAADRKEGCYTFDLPDEVPCDVSLGDCRQARAAIARTQEQSE